MTRYRRKRLIGRGGMGTVYEAERELPDGVLQPVACKVMRTGAGDALFIREAVVTLGVAHEHPGLVTTFDCFKDRDGKLVQVMELVDGCSLAALLQAYGPLSYAMARLILERLLDTLVLVHARELLHRDISPDNLLIRVDGEVKLADFGIATFIPGGRGVTTTPVGKLPYMGPEVLRCGAVDATTDLYSLGATLWEMLIGHPPFGAAGAPTDFIERWHKRLIAPLPADTPRVLRTLAEGWVCLQPERRAPRSAADALELLRGSDLASESKATLAEMVSALRERDHKHREQRRQRGAIRPGDESGKYIIEPADSEDAIAVEYGGEAWIGRDIEPGAAPIDVIERAGDPPAESEPYLDLVIEGSPDADDAARSRRGAQPRHGTERVPPPVGRPGTAVLAALMEPPSDSPWRARRKVIAFAACALVALGFVVTQFRGDTPRRPSSPQATAADNADRDVADGPEQPVDVAPSTPVATAISTRSAGADTATVAPTSPPAGDAARQNHIPELPVHRSIRADARHGATTSRSSPAHVRTRPPPRVDATKTWAARGRWR